MHDRKNGLREGVARALSQALVYGMEAQKTMIQVYGKGGASAAVAVRVMDGLAKGMLTSAATSGIVFGSYFTVYNSIGASNLWAGPVSAFTSSVIKIPISNSMRLMQAGLARNVVDAGRKIVRAQRVRGLYSGYGASLAEDIIEFDLRTRMYTALRPKGKGEGAGANAGMGLGLGAAVGMFAAWITTPFDTVRAHMALEAAGVAKKRSITATAMQLYRDGGVPALYRGAGMRAMSNAIKSGLFYMFCEALTFV